MGGNGKMRASSFLITAICVAGAIGAGPATAQDYTIRMSTESPTGSPNNVILSTFRDALQEELGDRVAIEFFEAGALGDEPLHLDMIRSGQIQAYPLGSDAVQLDPKWAIFDMPFLIADRDTAIRVSDGEIGQEMAASMRQRADLEVLGLGEVGFRQITNGVRPVVTPADLSGLRLRVPGSQTRIMAFQMLGANPITMNMGELYLSLQQGTVDGQENPLSVISSWSLYEVQAYTTLSRHVYSPVTLVMHGPTFDAMDDEAKEAVRRAAKIAVQATRDYGETSDRELIAQIETRTAINEIDLPAFQAAAEPIWTEIAKIAGEEFTEKVIAEARPQ
jgi:TRAP-type transport system periplasmic protein